MSVDTNNKAKTVDFGIENNKVISKEDQVANFLKNQLAKVKQLSSKSNFEGIYKPQKAMSISGEAKSPEEQVKVILKQQAVGSAIDSSKQEKLTALKDHMIALQGQMAKESFVNNQPVKAMAAQQAKVGSKDESKAKSSNAGKAKTSSLNPASAQAKTLEMKAAETDTKSKAALPVQFGDFDDDVGYASADTMLAQLTWKENIVSDWEDDVVSNKKKGDELIRLFYYYSKLAASGDMGAMYQFMKFITYVISKDKAKQQIDLGKKLIVMQEWSRSWTNKLLEVETDPNDASSSSELMKTMTLVKSETDSIAQSMKLLSQTMESFATDIETLTNVTKNAAEAYARIMRKVSAT